MKRRSTVQTSSKKARRIGSTRDRNGIWCSRPHTEVLGPNAMRERQVADAQHLEDRINEMDAAELRHFQDLHELPDSNAEDNDLEDWAMYDNVLDGTQQVDISHEGGELAALNAMRSDMAKGQHKRRRRVDYRVRRQRTELRNKAFEKEMPEMTQAYMDWQYREAHGQALPVEETGDSGWCHIRVIDVFATSSKRVVIPTSDTIVTALVRQGLIPCAPSNPSVCVTLQALELFRVVNLRSPHLSIHAFVKTLCDLHGVPFKRYLSTQFSITHDVHLAIRASVDSIVQAALRRDSPDWRLRHACPACTYKLKDEKELLFSLLFTMDGNDSLKRLVQYVLDDNGEPLRTREALDTRELNNDLYMASKEVDQWADEAFQDLMGDDFSQSTDVDPSSPDYNPCVDRWQNMKDNVTKRMWGIFDETVAKCGYLKDNAVDHSLLTKLYRAKYPLAVVAKMLRVFGKDLGGGYDIGCKFKSTLMRTPLADDVRDLNYSSLVGSFHGHAHRRLCQLSHLATYIKGLGLEDLEGCERAFSKSNAMAAAIRHSSTFHRRQAIDSYFKHNDDAEVFANLTIFLHDNYKQALDILQSGPTSLTQAMLDLRIADTAIFEQWREEEKVYLQGLSKEPMRETLQMEYYQKLVNLAAASHSLDAARNTWIQLGPSTAAAGYQSHDLSIEVARRKALALYEKDLNLVLDLETKLEIMTRWTPECEEWRQAGDLVAMRRYQRALDHVEGLIVARMFELTKMNMSKTGYKERKHLSKALQTRSQAIRTALDSYNAAARALTIPRRQLQWKEVVEYAFLSDFDLLRDARQDVSSKLWATPAGRLAMDLHYKIKHAREEVGRLNVEIRRVATFVRDEDRYLLHMETQLQTEDAHLAHQVALFRARRGCFNHEHQRRLIKISKLEGFTGTIVPGDAVESGPGEAASVWGMQDPVVGHGAGDVPSVSEDSEDEDVPEDQQDADAVAEEEDTDEELARTLDSVLSVAFD
ncbi:hypothetical protein HWV62_35063 [Athelia sp. TMB]|nr:hypothetical protein HWV62_35063 [Athelia sp. TMB]